LKKSLPIPKRLFDWRVLIAVVLFFNLAGYFLIPEILGVSRQKLFHFAGVAALEVPFMDLRGVATWCEASAIGIDPAVTQTTIILPDGTRQPNFLMNYSPAVVWFYWLGLRPATVWMWASALIALQILAVLGLCGRVSCRQAILWTFLVCSPASLLVMERANMDILVFAFFVLALALRRYPLAALAPILLAAGLKFYPAAALAALWSRGGMRQRLAAVGGLVIFLGILFLLKSQLAGIGASLYGQYQSAFGSTVVADLLKNHGACSESVAGFLSVALQIFALGLGVLSCGAGFFLSKKWPVEVTERANYSFWLAAPMFLVLFILSNQMDYKWIFLLFMFPAVLQLWDGKFPLWSVTSKIWLAAVCIYSYWTFFSGEESLRNAIFKQGVMWLVFVLSSLLCGALLARVPGFLKKGEVS
jgi:hypothetical protein